MNEDKSMDLSALIDTESTDVALPEELDEPDLFDEEADIDAEEEYADYDAEETNAKEETA